MIGRAFLETLLAVVLTLVLGVGAMVVGSVMEGSTLPEAFDGALGSLGLVVITLVVAAILWLVVNLVARGSSSAARFGWNMLVLFAACLLSSVFWFVYFGLIMGGWGGLIAAIGIFYTVGLFLAATIALALVHLAIIRRRATPT